MADINIIPFDNVHIKVQCEAGIAQELVSYFTFEVPGARFTPAYKNKKWDGKIKLFNYFHKKIYIGLIDKIKKFAERENYTVEDSFIPIGIEVTREDIQSFVDRLDFHLKDKKIVLRDYQVEAIYEAIHNDRKLLLSPTSSGKSAIIAGIIRWHLEQGRRCLIVVPTTSLVSQMYGDFEDYFGETWSVKDNCYKIMGGIEKRHEYPVTISTWQSLFRMDEDYFSQYEVVIVDECHLAKAKSIIGIMEKCTNSPFRIGCTGTLDGTKTNELVLTGLFGTVFKTISTKQLIDTKQISDLVIRCLVLQYSDVDKTLVKNMKYQDELDFIVRHEKRNKFIRNLALAQNGNTLILFNFVEKHGKPLYNMLLDKNSGRKIFFISGNVDADERESIRAILETETNAIVVASIGTTSTGVSIRNLHNIIFASPSKSRIRNLQAIGRGLRQHTSKTTCTLFDLSDDLSWKKYKNFTLKHAIERIKIYASENFNYKCTRVPLT